MREQIDPSRLDLTSYTDQQMLDTQYSDLDVLGHLNNVAIACMYQNARARFFREIFDSNSWNITAEGSPVLVKSTMQYLSEGFFPDPVTVAMSVESVGNSSYTLQQGLFQNNRCIGLCDVVFAYIAHGKSQRLPESMRATLLEKIAEREK